MIREKILHSSSSPLNDAFLRPVRLLHGVMLVDWVNSDDARAGLATKDDDFECFIRSEGYVIFFWDERSGEGRCEGWLTSGINAFWFEEEGGHCFLWVGDFLSLAFWLRFCWLSVGSVGFLFEVDARIFHPIVGHHILLPCFGVGAFSGSDGCGLLRSPSSAYPGLVRAADFSDGVVAAPIWQTLGASS